MLLTFPALELMLQVAPEQAATVLQPVLLKLLGILLKGEVGACAGRGLWPHRSTAPSMRLIVTCAVSKRLVKPVPIPIGTFETSSRCADWPCFMACVCLCICDSHTSDLS